MNTLFSIAPPPHTAQLFKNLGLWMKNPKDFNVAVYYYEGEAYMPLQAPVYLHDSECTLEESADYLLALSEGLEAYSAFKLQGYVWPYPTMTLGFCHAHALSNSYLLTLCLNDLEGARIQNDEYHIPLHRDGDRYRGLIQIRGLC